MSKGELIARGVSGNRFDGKNFVPSSAEGVARVIRGREVPEIIKQLSALKEGEILIGEIFEPEHDPTGHVLQRAAGIVMETGSWGSHGCKLMQDMDRPCVADTHTTGDVDVTKVIKTGQKVLVVGYTGSEETVNAKGRLRTYAYGAVYHSVGTVPLPTEHKLTMAEQIEAIKKKMKGG